MKLAIRVRLPAGRSPTHEHRTQARVNMGYRGGRLLVGASGGLILLGGVLF